MHKIFLSTLVLALSTTLALAAEPDAMAKDSMAKDSHTTSMQAMPPPGATSGDAMMSGDKMGAHDGMHADDKMMHDDKMMKDDNKPSK